MRVLFHCYEFPPQAGGVGSYIYQMASALTVMGHLPVIVTSRVDGLPAEESCDYGVVYRCYDRSEIRSSKVRDLVLSVARQHASDVIEGADHHGEMASIVKSSHRPPVLLKIHGSNPIRVLQDSHILYSWQRVFQKLAHVRNLGQTRAERFSIENADMALFPSKRMKDEIIAQGLSLPEKSMVLANPVIRFDGKLPEESNTPKILLVGRIDAGKGIQYIPNIIKTVAAEFPDVVLEIAGNDSYARGLGSMKQWLIAQLGGYVERVRFLGCLGRDDLDKAYGETWVVIIPSGWDNFPTVLLESMVRGKPVVASPYGGMPEMLEGTLCKTADPASPDFTALLLRFLRDSSARREAGASLKHKAESAYSPEVLVRKYVEALKGWGVA